MASNKSRFLDGVSFSSTLPAETLARRMISDKAAVVVNVREAYCVEHEVYPAQTKRGAGVDCNVYAYALELRRNKSRVL